MHASSRPHVSTLGDSSTEDADTSARASPDGRSRRLGARVAKHVTKPQYHVVGPTSPIGSRTRPQEDVQAPSPSQVPNCTTDNNVPSLSHYTVSQRVAPINAPERLSSEGGGACSPLLRHACSRVRVPPSCPDSQIMSPLFSSLPADEAIIPVTGMIHPPVALATRSGSSFHSSLDTGSGSPSNPAFDPAYALFIPHERADTQQWCSPTTPSGGISTTARHLGTQGRAFSSVSETPTPTKVFTREHTRVCQGSPLAGVTGHRSSASHTNVFADASSTLAFHSQLEGPSPTSEDMRTQVFAGTPLAQGRQQRTPTLAERLLVDRGGHPSPRAQRLPLDPMLSFSSLDSARVDSPRTKHTGDADEPDRDGTISPVPSDDDGSQVSLDASIVDYRSPVTTHTVFPRTPDAVLPATSGDAPCSPTHHPTAADAPCTPKDRILPVSQYTPAGGVLGHSPSPASRAYTPRLGVSQPTTPQKSTRRPNPHRSNTSLNFAAKAMNASMEVQSQLNISAASAVSPFPAAGLAVPSPGALADMSTDSSAVAVPAFDDYLAPSRNPYSAYRALPLEHLATAARAAAPADDDAMGAAAPHQPTPHAAVVIYGQAIPQAETRRIKHPDVASSANFMNLARTQHPRQPTPVVMMEEAEEEEEPQMLSERRPTAAYHFDGDELAATATWPVSGMQGSRGSFEQSTIYNHSPAGHSADNATNTASSPSPIVGGSSDVQGKQAGGAGAERRGSVSFLREGTTGDDYGMSLSPATALAQTVKRGPSGLHGLGLFSPEVVPASMVSQPRRGSTATEDEKCNAEHAADLPTPRKRLFSFCSGGTPNNKSNSCLAEAPRNEWQLFTTAETDDDPSATSTVARMTATAAWSASSRDGYPSTRLGFSQNGTAGGSGWGISPLTKATTSARECPHETRVPPTHHKLQLPPNARSHLMPNNTAPTSVAEEQFLQRLNATHPHPPQLVTSGRRDTWPGNRSSSHVHVDASFTESASSGTFLSPSQRQTHWHGGGGDASFHSQHSNGPAKPRALWPHGALKFSDSSDTGSIPSGEGREGHTWFGLRGAVDDEDAEYEPGDRFLQHHTFQFAHHMQGIGKEAVFVPYSADANGLVWVATHRLDGLPYAVKEVQVGSTAQWDQLHTELECLTLGNDAATVLERQAELFLARYYTCKSFPITVMCAPSIATGGGGGTRSSSSGLFAPRSPPSAMLAAGGSTTDAAPVFLLQTEYFPSGSVCEYVASHATQGFLQRFPWHTLLTHALLGLEALHGHRLIHGCPLPFNIFVSDNGTHFKLGNFGSAAKMPKRHPLSCSTLLGSPSGAAHSNAYAAEVHFLCCGLLGVFAAILGSPHQPGVLPLEGLTPTGVMRECSDVSKLDALAFERAGELVSTFGCPPQLIDLLQASRRTALSAEHALGILGRVTLDEMMACRVCDHEIARLESELLALGVCSDFRDADAHRGPVSRMGELPPLAPTAGSVDNSTVWGGPRTSATMEVTPEAQKAAGDIVAVHQNTKAELSEVLSGHARDVLVFHKLNGTPTNATITRPLTSWEVL